MQAGPRFTFHIGAHKTGTTYLQSMFLILTPALRERGVLVPETWYRKANQGGHHILPTALESGPESRLRDEFNAIRDTGCPEVLISAESLSGLSERALYRLRRLMDGAETQFIYHCRRWSDQIPSLWQTAVRGRREEPFPAFYRQTIETASTVLNFGSNLDRFAEAFGRTRVSIVSYSSVVEANQNLAAYFFRTFLPDVPDVAEMAENAPSPPRNVSLPFWQMEIIRGMNALSREQGAAFRLGPSSWLRQRADGLSLNKIEEALTQARQEVTLDDNRPRLRVLHERLFQAWGDRLVAPAPEHGFFTPATRVVPFVHPARLRSPDVRPLLRELFDLYQDYGTSELA